MVKLTLAELGSLDPRPLRVVLADAVATADLVHRDLKQTALHGTPTAADVARLMDAAKYCSALASAALSAGVVDVEPEPPVTAKTRDMIAEVFAEALLSIVDDLTLGELPPARGHVMLAWARDALQLYVGALDRGEPPPSPPPKPVVGLPAASASSTFARRALDDDVVDVEDVDDAGGLSPEDEAELASLKELIFPARRYR